MMLDPGYEELDDFMDGMPAKDIEHDTKRTRRISVLGSIAAFIAILTIVPVALAMPVASSLKAVWDEGATALDTIPDDVPPIPTSLPGITYVYASDGTVIAQFYAENRTPVEFDGVSEWLIKAIVDVEDRRFWLHHGVDGESIFRAGVTNVQAGATVQGASTLTQQLVENLKLLDASTEDEVEDAKAKSLGGKLVEAKTALALEEELSKEEILEAYMNVVYFGSGSYGVAAAAQRFFGVDVADLSLPQAALIAGMVREPSGLDPFVNPERAKNRRDTVLAAMYDVGDITLEEFHEAMATPLDTSNGIRPANGCAKSDYPFYCAIVRDQLLADTRLGRTQAQRDARFYQGHLDVYTALDPAVMDAVNDSIDDALDTTNRVATAVVVVEPGSGLVRAVGQNRDWGSGEGHTEITYGMSAFQPGSTFKATVAATALKQGISPYTKLNGNSGYKPAGFDYPVGGFDNSNGVNLGSIDMFSGARYSSNAYFTNLITRTGVLAVVETAKDMGVSTSLNDKTISSRSAAFALGAWEVTPLEMASVYATIAAAGSSCEPVFITDIVDTTTDESLTTSRITCETVYSESVSTDLIQVMRQPFTAGGTARSFPLSNGREAVGKTGTTNNHAAAWFVGATAQYSTAVWIGDPRGGQAYPLRDVTAYGKTFEKVYGADISGPLWNSVMEKIHANLPRVSFSSIEQSAISPKSLADLVTAPAVRGMSVLEAVSLLNSAGYGVTISSEVDTYGQQGVVSTSTADGPYVDLIVGAGTDRDILGQEVRVTNNTLTIVNGDGE